MLGNRAIKKSALLWTFYLASFFEGQVTVASGHDSTFLHFFASELSSFLGRNASCCDSKQLFPRLAGDTLHGGTGAAYSVDPDQSITAFCNLLIGLSRETGFRPACRTAERPRQKQTGQAPSGNRGAARQRVHPEVHREALQILACQPRKLDEEARNQETEAVKSYGRFGTFS